MGNERGFSAETSWGTLLRDELEPGTPRSEIIQAGIDKGLKQVRIDPETGIDGAGRVLLNGERPWEVQTPDGRCFILSQQRLQSGDLIVTEAIGGGLAWGAVVLRW